MMLIIAIDHLGFSYPKSFIKKIKGIWQWLLVILIAILSKNYF